jgi:hypothetical protein
MTPDVRSAALEYHARGWSVLPVTPEKRPALRTWRQYQDRRPTDGQLRRWFRNGERGVGVVLGDVSGGLVCRDFDRMDAYESWAARFLNLANALPTVQTARGRHVYCRCKRRGIIDLGDGEFRGGGIVVLPPSRHASGVLYKWVVPLPDGPVPTVDPALAGLLGLVGTERAQKRTEENRENRSNGGGVELDEQDVARVIQATLPDGPGKRHRQVFRLARGLRGLVGDADIDPGTLRSIVREWHHRALPVITTKAFEETWIDFLRGWPRVKFPMGVHYMAEALERARQAPPVPEAAEYESEGPRLLARLCRELQTDAGEGPFFLSNRTAASLLDVPTMQANRWLFLLVADGVLSVATKGGTVDAPRRATRYRFNGKL